MYKAVIFDLGKVLIHFDFRRGYERLEQLCPYPAAEIPKRLAPTGLVRQLETGLIEPEPFFEAFCRTLDLRLDYEQFREIWSSIFLHAILPEEMLESLARRYRLVLLSNTNALHFEMLSGAYDHLLRHFHARILSHEVKAMKPDPAIYLAAVEAAQCAPQECFYTDDIPEFVEAARVVGIDAVVFQSREQIERELRARGIEW
jgi:HAD superfamily hydrolase (TIGR01509 family)